MEGGTMKIPCTACSLDLKTYKIYDKNHVEIQPNADNEIVIDIMFVKQKISIFHCVYLTLFKSCIPNTKNSETKYRGQNIF